MTDYYTCRDCHGYIFTCGCRERKEPAIAAMQPAPQEPVGSAAEITRLTEALRAAEDQVKGLVRLVERAQVNTPDQYVNWHEHARQALAGAKP